MTDHNNHPPWHLTNIQAKRVDMRMEVTGDVVPGLQLHLSFLDRKPSVLITKKGMDDKQKYIQFAIPRGITTEQLYDLFRQLPDAIEHHLNPEQETTNEA